MHDLELNARALEIAEDLAQDEERLRVRRHMLPGGAEVFDLGVETVGGLAAGLELSDVCLAGLGDVAISSQSLLGRSRPHVEIATDQPVGACLLSQYAGHAVTGEGYFAMGSGPMRAAIAKEEIFTTLGYSEKTTEAIGVLETDALPSEEIVNGLADACGVKPKQFTLLVAPVTSLAGTVQVVARSVETAMHQLMELGFDLLRVQSGFGVAPLPPVAKETLDGIGRTNDAIINGASVTLWVTGDDAMIQEFGPRVPSSSSESFGRPFAELFEEAGRDFYAMDKSLFSPALVTFHNLETGSTFHFGEIGETVLRSVFEGS